VFKTNPDSIFRDADQNDIIVIASQECEYKSYRVQEISDYLTSKGFLNIDSFVGMWEMFIAVFVKKGLRKEIQDVQKHYIAKGKYGVIGNKGCVAYSFVLRERPFNFICCHLQHGQNKFQLRNEMMGQLIRELKLQPSLYKGLECDAQLGYTFILGDLNYRLDSTFSKLVPSINDALKPELD
jgi:hypothetical protein